MKKILISMLGLGSYKKETNSFGYDEANYSFLQEDFHKMSYHQLPIASKINPEIVWLVGTIDAKNTHIQRLHEAGLQIDSFLVIPKGTNEDEFWQIFEVLNKQLQELPPEENYELYLDLTHGFRVQPMFLLAAVRYFCQLHESNFKIADIYYSMYENSKLADHKNPILSVIPILEMEQIASEVRAFLEHGSSTALSRRLKKMEMEINQEILSKVDEAGLKGKEKAKEIVKKRQEYPILQFLKIYDNINSFGELIGLNYTPGAAECVRRLCELGSKAGEQFVGKYKPMGQAFKKLADELNQFFPSELRPLWQWHLAIAKWCLERNMTQQALTHVNEVLMTRYCEENGLDCLEKNNRNKLPELVMENHKPRKDLSPEWADLLNSHLVLNDSRNAVNHAFCRNTKQSIQEFSKGVKRQLEKVLNLHYGMSKLPDFS